MQERAELYRACTGARADSLHITHIMATQVWHRTRPVRGLQGGRAGPVLVLCRACTDPVQVLCKNGGHICPSRPLSVK